MDRAALEQKITSLLTQVNSFPEESKKEIMQDMATYSEEDLAALLDTLIEWDKDVSDIYEEQADKLLGLTQEIEEDLDN